MDGDSADENTLRKEAFYGENYEPTYTPLAAIPAAQAAPRLYPDLGDHHENADNIIQDGTDNGIDEEVLEQTYDFDTFDQTSYENELLRSNVKQEDSDHDDFSQIPGNQAFITRIDDFFTDAPLESYIERLLTFMQGKEGLITWYRSILICRIKGVNENPLFSNAPVQRKNTAKSSSAHKYAKDCYYLNSYIHGDMTAPVDDIFTGRTAKPSQSAESQIEAQQEKSIEIACTKQLIQSLRKEVNEIKSSHSETIKNMQSQISALQKEHRALKLVVSRLEAELNTKTVLYDAKIKQMSSAMKDLEQINPYEIATRMNALDANSKRLDSNVAKLLSANQKQHRSDRIPTQSDNSIQQGSPHPVSPKSPTEDMYTSHPSSSNVSRTGTGSATLRAPPSTSGSATCDTQSAKNNSDATSANNISMLSNKPYCHLSNSQAAGNQATHTVFTNTCSSNSYRNMNPCVPGMVPAGSGRPFGIQHMGHLPNMLPIRPPYCTQFVPNQTLLPPPPVNPTQLNAQTQNPYQTLSAHQAAPAPDPNAQRESDNGLSSQRVNDEDIHHNYANSSLMGMTHSTQEAVGAENHAPARPTRSNDNGEGQTTAHPADDVFIGVRREKRKRYFKYYVSNIDERSTRGGILSHFSKNGVEIHELQLLRSRNDKCYARIVVESQYKNSIESDDFPWPDNVYCTYWKRNQRRENNRRYEDKDSRNNDKRDERPYRRKV